jgi:hypothetical protein
MFCLLRRFFARLTDYEFLSSISSIDFYHKTIRMKPYFWKGTMILFIKYFDHQTDNKKRKLAYIIKQVMLERLTSVSDGAMRKFFEQQIHVSCIKYKSKLKRFLNETYQNQRNDDSTNTSELDQINNPPSMMEKQLAILAQHEEQYYNSDDDDSLLESIVTPEREIESEHQLNSDDNSSEDNYQIGTSTQWMDTANTLAENVVNAQLIVESLPTARFYSDSVVANIINEVKNMDSPPAQYAQLALAYNDREEAISTYTSFIQQPSNSTPTYREGSPLGDEFFEDLERSYVTYDDSRLELYDSD